MIYLIPGLAIFLTIYWGGIAWRAWQGSSATPSLPPLPTASKTFPTAQPPLSRPRVSIIVPARNEAARIRQTIEQLVQQRGLTFEIILVNDRSTDDTGAIIAEISHQYPGQVRCVHVTELPERWLGKCHACALGANEAAGEWLLFADGDIHMRDDVVARAVLQAERERADHLTLFPNLVANHFGPRLAIAGQAILFLLYTQPANINRDRGRRSVGIGAFNLIRRSTYNAIGGHERLRLEVVDDMRLGELVRKHQFRQRVYLGVDDIQADWAQSALGVVRALEKNWFALMDYRLGASVFLLLSVGMSIVLAITAPIWAGAIGWAPWLAWAAVGVPGVRIARQFHWPWYIGWFSTLGWFVFLTAGAHSVWKTTRQGGIWWRDRFYPLAELRGGRAGEG